MTIAWCMLQCPAALFRPSAPQTILHDLHTLKIGLAALGCLAGLAQAADAPAPAPPPAINYVCKLPTRQWSNPGRMVTLTVQTAAQLETRLKLLHGDAYRGAAQDCMTEAQWQAGFFK
jgi:hypothetical protein